MDNFDFFRTSKFKIDDVITSKYGGRYSKSEAFNLGGIGIAGLIHYKNEEENSPFLKVNLELLRGGLAIYYRNIDQNNVTIFSFDEISKISLKKESHILVPKSYSIFNKLLKLGFNFYTAKLFLLEQEIIAEYKPELIIESNQYDDMVMYVHRKSPMPIVDFLKKASSQVDLLIDIAEYKYV